MKPKPENENRRTRIALPDAGTRPFGDLPVRNRLLAALPCETLTALRWHLETIEVAPAAPLCDGDGSIAHVYFPETAVLSLEDTRDAAGVSQTDTIGNEGMAGLSVFLNGCVSHRRAFVSVPGVVRRMDARVFRRLAERPGPFHRVMLGYAQLSLTQVAQTAACAAGHLLQARCAGLLLTTRRRVDATAFTLADESLSVMLDVHRAGVTVAMRTLHERQLIRSIGDRIEILDALALERESCDCYGKMRREYARLLPAVA
jgi:hypothetical protein